MVSTGKLPLDKIITHKYPLSQFKEGIEQVNNNINNNNRYDRTENLVLLCGKEHSTELKYFWIKLSKICTFVLKIDPNMAGNQVRRKICLTLLSDVKLPSFFFSLCQTSFVSPRAPDLVRI